MGSWGHGLLGSDMGSWGQTWEAVQEFPVEIHKSLPSNGLRVSSLIKVVSLLARTYGKKRRILGQPPRGSIPVVVTNVKFGSSGFRDAPSSQTVQAAAIVRSAAPFPEEQGTTGLLIGIRHLSQASTCDDRGGPCQGSRQTYSRTVRQPVHSLSPAAGWVGGCFPM